MATVYVNDLPVDIGNEKLNCVQAAEKAGVLIPHYCYHPALSVVASCRMCLVEVGEKKPDGTISMMPKVVPGCQTPVKDGTVIVTRSDKAKDAQERTLESLLLNHPLDCPVCDKAGECTLQDYSFGFGKAESRMHDEKKTPPNKPDLGPNIDLFTDRCIMCSRCVRFTREISGTSELYITHRGDHSEIAVFPGDPLDNKLSTNVVDLCPVGALASKDFLYKQRVWNLKTVDSVCPGCSTGCSIHIDGNKGVIHRLRPRANPKAQGHFMCDEGRLGYHYANSADRLREASIRGPHGWTPVGHREAVQTAKQGFNEHSLRSITGVWAVLSPFMTVEEAYLLALWIRDFGKEARLVLGPVPREGEDDHYPKDSRGNVALGVPKFTIRAEKCPNRIGVEAILKHFTGTVIGFDAFLTALGKGQVKSAFLAGGYLPTGRGHWFPAEAVPLLEQVNMLVVQEIFTSALSQKAHVVFPSATWAEKEGTFLNHQGLAQEIHWNSAPPGESRTDGQVYLDLLGRTGLMRAHQLRREIAQVIPSLSQLSTGHLGTEGVLPGEAPPVQSPKRKIPVS